MKDVSLQAALTQIVFRHYTENTFTDLTINAHLLLPVVSVFYIQELRAHVNEHLETMLIVDLQELGIQLTFFTVLRHVESPPHCYLVCE